MIPGAVVNFSPENSKAEDAANLSYGEQLLLDNAISFLSKPLQVYLGEFKQEGMGKGVLTTVISDSSSA